MEGGPVASVACPAPELAQVLDVLVDNAVKYAGTGATARIGWNARGGRESPIAVARWVAFSS